MDPVSTENWKSVKLDRSDARALHEQLTDRLLYEFLPKRDVGDRIPTEHEIVEILGVSRVTVRRAIDTLVKRGILVRRRGKGTFVARAKPKIVYEIDRIGPFLDAIAASGETAEALLLDFNWVHGESVPSCFPPRSSALVYSRVYVTEGAPHALLQISVPQRIGEHISRADASSSGIYKLLRERVGAIPARANFSISTEMPNADLVRKLKTSPTSPLLVVERTSYDAKGVAIENTIHYLLPEVYRLNVNITSFKN